MPHSKRCCLEHTHRTVVHVPGNDAIVRARVASRIVHVQFVSGSRHVLRCDVQCMPGVASHGGYGIAMEGGEHVHLCQ